ncbi:CzcE family metal-binding protein [Massilia sp. RP-1-19]|uniref:CzcE family metal-binding protein n=1 Tax=Massilia polaris TaxID=2728846 RepID=A0A848HG73_9BURK|nr:CzcE family metal-binding protein [Massilia polaris]NML60067.1 CzcE family metal-binding protein [Massilia polaris]
MQKFNRATFVLITALLGGAAGAAGLTNTGADYGYVALTAPVDRTIVIDASTKVVNVTNGETVEFKIDGQSIRWHFNTFHRESVLDLSKIVPQAAQAANVRVYVAANPLYQS